nr:MAG TPA: hypothetical protein [Caudoviricetes sp.]
MRPFLKDGQRESESDASAQAHRAGLVRPHLPFNYATEVMQRGKGS